MRHSLTLRWWLGVVLIASFSGALVQVRAAAAAAPAYTHSWYIKDPSDAAMKNLGKADGTRDSACTDHVVVLNFGQPTQEAWRGGSYEGYGVSTFLPGAPYINDSVVVQAARMYAYGWWLTTPGCSQLKLAIGVNNYHECPMGLVDPADPTCSTSRAGYEWAWVISNVKSYVATTLSLAAQITVWAGDDIETGYDTYAKTSGMVTGYNSQITQVQYPLARFLDFGDAFTGGDWTTAHIEYVSWGATSNWPLPLMFLSSWATTWTAIRQAYPTTAMHFLGVMTECNVQSDPLPTGSCAVSDGIASSEYSPSLAWNTFNSTLSTGGFGQATLEYATNIRDQP